MQVGELFINMGLMGTDKLAKGLESANKSLNQIKETGLESAFRLKNVFGQFEDQVSTFTNMGSVLKVFEDQTGLSAVTLQKFQKAFMGVNVSADETRSTMLNLQNIMNTIQRGGAVPAAMSEALRRMNIDVNSIKDIYGFAKKFQDVAKTMDVAIGRDIAKDLGISGTMWQGFRSYTGDVEKERAWLSESQFRASAKMNANLNKMKADIETGFAKLLLSPATGKAMNAMYKIIMAFINLLDAVLKFADKTGLLDVLEKVLMFFGDFLTSIMMIASKYIEQKGGKDKNAFLEFEKSVNPISAVYSHFTGEHPLETMFKGGKILTGLAKDYNTGEKTVNNVTIHQDIKSTDPVRAGKESAKSYTHEMKNISPQRKN